MLGLLVPTDPRWVEVALGDFDAVLLDHLHCELKAASNAMAIVARHPTNARLVRELTALAREELEHVLQVHERVVSRGIAPRPPDRDPYAAALRQASALRGSDPRVDRLLVAALIEARSCERFSLLREHAPTDDLRTWYAALFESEARHYRLFASLAEDVVGADRARERLAQLAEHEAVIVQELPLLARVH